MLDFGTVIEKVDTEIMIVTGGSLLSAAVLLRCCPLCLLHVGQRREATVTNRGVDPRGRRLGAEVGSEAVLQRRRLRPPAASSHRPRGRRSGNRPRRQGAPASPGPGPGQRLPVPGRASEVRRPCPGENIRRD